MDLRAIGPIPLPPMIQTLCETMPAPLHESYYENVMDRLFEINPKKYGWQWADYFITL